MRSRVSRAVASSAGVISTVRPERLSHQLQQLELGHVVAEDVAKTVGVEVVPHDAIDHPAQLDRRHAVPQVITITLAASLRQEPIEQRIVIVPFGADDGRAEHHAVAGFADRLGSSVQIGRRRRIVLGVLPPPAVVHAIRRYVDEPHRLGLAVVGQKARPQAVELIEVRRSGLHVAIDQAHRIDAEVRVGQIEAGSPDRGAHRIAAGRSRGRDVRRRGVAAAPPCPAFLPRPGRRQKDPASPCSLIDRTLGRKSLPES